MRSYLVVVSYMSEEFAEMGSILGGECGCECDNLTWCMSVYLVLGKC